MDLALFLVRCLLAVVFIVSGVAKLFDRPGSARVAVDLGVPRALAPAVARLLPLVELTLAIALLLPELARYAALAAASMLLAFTVAITVNVVRGRRPSCHCFGSLQTTPVSWWTALRHGGLLATAVFVLWQGWDDAGSGVTTWTDSVTVASIVAPVIGVLTIGTAMVAIFLWQDNQRLRSPRRHEAPAIGDPATTIDENIGQPAPSFRLPNLAGQPVTLDALRAAGKPVMLLCVAPDCFACRQLAPFILDWQRTEAEHLTVAVISRGGAAENRKKFEDIDEDHLLLQQYDEVDILFGVSGTPTGILVSADGVIAEAMANGGIEIVEIMMRTIPSSPDPVPSLNGSRSASEYRHFNCRISPAESSTRPACSVRRWCCCSGILTAVTVSASSSRYRDGKHSGLNARQSSWSCRVPTRTRMARRLFAPPCCWTGLRV